MDVDISEEEIVKAVLLGCDYADVVLNDDLEDAIDRIEEFEDILRLNGIKLSHEKDELAASCAKVASFAQGFYQTLHRKLV